MIDRFPKICIRLYYYWSSFSSNMKVGEWGWEGVILIYPE